MQIVLAAIIFVLATGAAIAERRVALVFGADRYEVIRPLKNAVNDARAVEAALEALNFEVFFESNRNLRRVRRALNDFAEDAAGADVALVFFAGHGVEISGENRLLPTDADASSLDALKKSSLPLEELRRAVSAAAKISLIVLDACRDDPFATASDPADRGVDALSLPKTIKPGLARVGRAENTLFAFAAAPGETAADGEGANSPFTKAFAKYLGTDGLEIRSVLTLVQQEVYERTNGMQLPYVESGLPELFFASRTSDELPERERLLLAMAEVTPEVRGQVEQIASDADIPLAPLFGALISSDLGKLNRRDRGDKLTEAAEAFIKVRNELRTFRSTDGRVDALRLEAEEQLSLGAFETVREKLTEAAEIDAASRQTLKANFIKRTVSEATTHHLKGSAALAELKYQIAIADLEKARSLFEEVNEQIADVDAHQYTVTLKTLGETYLTVGSLLNARSAYDDMLRLAKRRAEEDPDNLSRQHNYMLSHIQIGFVLRMAGELDSALGAYQKSLEIAERLAAADPTDSNWQFNLVFIYEHISDLENDRDESVSALVASKKGLGIAKRLATTDPSNSKWQSAIGAFQNNIGDSFHSLGDLSQAMDAYQAAVEIVEKLAESDPQNVRWRRSMAASYSRIGNIHQAQGKQKSALSVYEASLEILEGLAVIDPSNTEYKRDLVAIHGSIGNIHQEFGNPKDALKEFLVGLKIAQQLADLDRSNALWQRDLMVIHEKIALLGHNPKTHYEKALEIANALEVEGKLSQSDKQMIEDLKKQFEKN